MNVFTCGTDHRCTRLLVRHYLSAFLHFAQILNLTYVLLGIFHANACGSLCYSLVPKMV